MSTTTQQTAMTALTDGGQKRKREDDDGDINHGSGPQKKTRGGQFKNVCIHCKQPSHKWVECKQTCIHCGPNHHSAIEGVRPATRCLKLLAHRPRIYDRKDWNKRNAAATFASRYAVHPAANTSIPPTTASYGMIGALPTPTRSAASAIFASGLPSTPAQSDSVGLSAFTTFQRPITAQATTGETWQASRTLALRPLANHNNVSTLSQTPAQTFQFSAGPRQAPPLTSAPGRRTFTPVVKIEEWDGNS